MGRLNGAHFNIDSLRDRPRGPGILEVLAAALGATLPIATAEAGMASPAPASAPAVKGTGGDGSDAQE